MNHFASFHPERVRQRIAESLQVSDQETVDSFSRITRILGHSLKPAMAGFSLVAGDSVSYLAPYGESTPDSIARSKSFCGHAIQQDDIFVVEDALHDKRFMNHPFVRTEGGIRFYAGLPVRSPTGHAVGALCALDRQPRELTSEHQELMRDLRTTLENEITIRATSKIDPLTSVPNRRGFEERLKLEWRRAERSSKAVALMMIDADFFKLYNDHYGHAAGDEALQNIAMALTSQASRAGDLVGRFGGEEFAALLVETDWQGARVCADRMCQQVEALGIPHKFAPNGLLSVSVGVAVSQSAEDLRAGPEAFLRRADIALYLAKNLGRSCSVVQFLDGSPIPLPPSDERYHQGPAWVEKDRPLQMGR